MMSKCNDYNFLFLLKMGWDIIWKCAFEIQCGVSCEIVSPCKSSILHGKNDILFIWNDNIILVEIILIF